MQNRILTTGLGPLFENVPPRSAMLLLQVHESVNGTSRTSRDVRFSAAVGDKRTSNAPSPGVAFMSTQRSERAQPFEAQQGVAARGPREPAA